MDKILISKTCKQCSNNFDITQGDRNFYTKISPTFGGKKYGIPDPTLCPECRSERRLARLNELQLYKHICHGCGTNIISRFHPESLFKNYCNKCWASDSWDARDYGREVDFSRNFFEQIDELQKEVPFQNLIGSLSNIENNAVYTNHTADIKDSYMVSESDNTENCYYSRNIRKSSFLFDCSYATASEYSYECSYVANLYKCFFISRSEACRNSHFLFDCLDCDSCIACVGLERKKFCVLNKEVSEEEFLELRGKILSGDTQILAAYIQLKDNYPQKYFIKFSEDCSGGSLLHCKNCHSCTNTIFSEDCRYCNDVNNSQDLGDISSYGSNSYLMYEGLGVGRYSNNVLFSSIVGRGESLLYCIDTKKSQNCFGCVNMKDAQYCILNKQYTREEYERLVPQIIEGMIATGEWGEFFPAWMSPVPKGG